MKRILCIFLVVTFALGMCLAASAQSQSPGARLLELLHNPEAKRSESEPSAEPYELGTDVLYSIPMIAGSREIILSAQGDTSLEYSYKSAAVRDDLLAYIDYLGEVGFEVVRGGSLSEPGEGELSGPSKDAGARITVRLDWTQEEYRIQISKDGATTNTTQTQDPSDILVRGEAAVEAEQYEEALAIFDAALAENPEVAAYHSGRAEALNLLERYEEALDTADTAIRLDPAAWEGYNERGVAYFSLDQWEKSLEAFEDAMALGPDNSDGYHNLAFLQAVNGDLETALETCMTGLVYYPDDDALWALYGDFCYALEDYTVALSAYDTAISYGRYTEEDFPAYAETKQKASVTQPAQTRPEGTSGLMHYEDWILQYDERLPFSRSILDTFLDSRDLGNGLVEESVEYPRAWPGQWLDGVVPAYAGAGWMFDLYVVRPAMSYAAEDVRHVAVTVYDYQAEDVDAYIAELLADGFAEERDTRYAADWMEEVRSFRKGNCTLNIILAHGAWPVYYISTDDTLDPDTPLPFVQFNVDFDREPYTLDITPTPYTELLNYHQFGDLMGWPEEGRSATDVVTETWVDEHNRMNEYIYYPTVWPKDVFGDMVPEYRSFGMMYTLYVTMPAPDPTRDQTLIATLDIVAQTPEDVEAYAQEIIDFGYREVPPEEYTDAESVNAADCSIFRAFTLPSMELYLSVFEGAEGMEYLGITLRFDGRRENFFAQ